MVAVSSQPTAARTVGALHRRFPQRTASAWKDWNELMRRTKLDCQQQEVKFLEPALPPAESPEKCEQQTWQKELQSNGWQIPAAASSTKPNGQFAPRKGMGPVPKRMETSR